MGFGKTSAWRRSERLRGSRWIGEVVGLGMNEVYNKLRMGGGICGEMKRRRIAELVGASKGIEICTS